MNFPPILLGLLLSSIVVDVVVVVKVYLFILIERESAGGAERQGERVSSRLCAVSMEPTMGLKLAEL